MTDMMRGLKTFVLIIEVTKTSMELARLMFGEMGEAKGEGFCFLSGFGKEESS